MEKTQLAYVLPVDFGWDDLGINAIELLQRGCSNVELANHVGLDTQFFYATEEEDVIVTIGLEGDCACDRNVTLIVKKDRTEIKQVPKPCKMTQNSQISCK